MPDHDEQLYELLESKLRVSCNTHMDMLQELSGANLNPGERKTLQKILAINSNGLLPSMKRLRSDGSKDSLIQMIELFCTIGPTAILQTGAQRGGDFLLNQLRGQWAEDVCRSLDWPSQKIVEYGPSGAAMPGEEDYDTVVRAFRGITLIEGKRPDLLAFSQDMWDNADDTAANSVSEWPMRSLTDTELDLVSQCTCGIEVKNSTWHYSRRRNAGGGPLAVTVKDEELEDISNWSTRFNSPVLFMQVLFDEIYCMSFQRMKDAITRGYLYEKDDYIAEVDRKSQKHYHRFFLNDQRHMCANTIFPDSSSAVISVLPDGNVIPYIKYSPANSDNCNANVIENELNYV